MKKKPFKKTDSKEEAKDLKDVEEEIVVEQGQEISELEKKSKEYLEGWKRCQADFENYKKIQSDNQKDLIRYAAQNVILQIIPVIDNFHAATAHVPEDQQGGGWVQGIMYIQKQLEDVLVQNGVNEIEARIGDEFDPNLHEALEESSDKKNDDEDKAHKLENKIKKIIQKGYRIGEKVIRPVKVIVG